MKYPSARRRIIELVIALAWAALAGVCNAMQGPTNTALSRIGGRAQATFVSFAGGTILLLVLVPLLGQGDITAVTRVPWWQCITGLYGFLVIVSVVFSTPRLGIALTLMILMFGKLTMGAVIDAFGLIIGIPVPLSPMRIVGLLLVAVGIVLVSIARMRTSASTGVQRGAGNVAAFLLVAVAGAGNAIQAPTLTALSSSTGQLEASLINFIGGLLCATIYLLVTQRGKIQSMKGSKPWQYLGGAYGTAIVLIVMSVMPILGVGLLVAAQMLGQLTWAMIVDARGWLGCVRIPISTWRIAGVIFVATGVLTIALLG